MIGAAPTKSEVPAAAKTKALSDVSHQSSGWGWLLIAGQQRLVNALQALRPQQLNGANAHELGAALNQAAARATQLLNNSIQVQ